MENAEQIAYLAAEIDLLRDPLAAALREITERAGVTPFFFAAWYLVEYTNERRTQLSRRLYPAVPQ
jgi:hypothetical protein